MRKRIGRHKKFPEGRKTEEMGKAALWAANIVVPGDQDASWPGGNDRDDIVQETAITVLWGLLRSAHRWGYGRRSNRLAKDRRLRRYALFLAKKAMLEVLMSKARSIRFSDDALDTPRRMRLDMLANKHVERLDRAA